jgi:hypothetical protein
VYYFNGNFSRGGKVLGNWELVDYLIAVGLLAVFGLYISLGFFWLRYMYKNSQKRREEFYNILLDGLRIGTIESLEDVYNIYNGLNSSNVSSGDNRLNSYLQGFIVKLQSKILVEANNEEDIVKWKKFMTDLLAKNKEISPFSELPVSERNIMNDVLAYLESEDKDSIKRKMRELSVLIQTRSEHLEKTEKQNKLSVPLAVIGLILTIVFGIFSLI